MAKTETQTREACQGPSYPNQNPRPGQELRRRGIPEGIIKVEYEIRAWPGAKVMNRESSWAICSGHPMSFIVAYTIQEDQSSNVFNDTTSRTISIKLCLDHTGVAR